MIVPGKENLVEAMGLLPRLLPVEWRSDGWLNGSAVYRRRGGVAVLLSASREDDGLVWLHASASRRDRVPNYAEMSEVKRVFIGTRRRMTLAEAIERRARMAACFGSITLALNRGAERSFAGPHGGNIGHRNHDRRWASDFCQRNECDEDVGDDVAAPEDVALLDGIPVAMCSRCRAAQRERPQPFEVETMEDLAEQFLDAIERLIGGSP